WPDEAERVLDGDLVECEQAVAIRVVDVDSRLPEAAGRVAGDVTLVAAVQQDRINALAQLDGLVVERRAGGPQRPAERLGVDDTRGERDLQPGVADLADVLEARAAQCHGIRLP